MGDQPDALVGHDRTARWADWLVDGSVAALAAWTVVFHIARWMELTRSVALVAWMVGLVAWLVFRRQFPVPSGGSPLALSTVRSANSRFENIAMGGLLTVAAVLAWLEVDGLWWPGLWCALAGFLVMAVRQSVPAGGKGGDGAGRRRQVDPIGATGAAAASVIILAVLMAALSLVMVRPDQDDVFVVNRSTWIAEHDTTFPERDTIFSDDVLPVERPAGLPTSVEALVGAVAAVLSVGAASLSYLGLGPLVAALSVLATWRLLRGLGARSPALATWVGTAFLVLDGVEHGSFGNFSAGRSWQGKVVFLVVVVPTLWHHANAWGGTGCRRHLRAASLGVLAGLGLSSTAVLVAPTVVVAASVAGAMSAEPGGFLVGRVQRTRICWAIGAVVPALLVGLWALVADPQRLVNQASSAAVMAGLRLRAALDPLQWLDSGTEPIAIVRMVFGRGPTAFVGLAAALLAWTVARERNARLLLLAAPLAAFGVFGAPGVFDVLNEVGEADAIAWRMLWVLPLPAMVGLVLTARRSGFGAAPVVIPVVVLALVLVTGTPITSSANRGTELVWPPTIDLPRPEASSARRLIDLAPKGGQVAGPAEIDFAVSVLTSEVKATNPRAAYLQGRHVNDSFGAVDRRILTHALAHGYAEWGADAFSDALGLLRPDAVCLALMTLSDGTEVVGVLVDRGYRSAGSDQSCRFWTLVSATVPAE